LDASATPASYHGRLAESRNVPYNALRGELRFSVINFIQSLCFCVMLPI
jgi:hypothetical protein